MIIQQDRLQETKENKSEGRSELLLGRDNNIEFLKHFMNILLKDKSTET